MISEKQKSIKESMHNDKSEDKSLKSSIIFLMSLKTIAITLLVGIPLTTMGAASVRNTIKLYGNDICTSVCSIVMKGRPCHNSHNTSGAPHASMKNDAVPSTKKIISHHMGG